LYKNSKGFRPYKTIFNFKEHGAELIEYLKKRDIENSEISKITRDEKVYYNLKDINCTWKTIGNNCKAITVNNYLNFLKTYKLIDFNLINLLALFIIQENHVVKRALNKSIDWILIDEFQDVSEIQCKIIEKLSSNRVNQEHETKWFMVGDPNQSIYGFAGANPRSMYDMKIFFNNLHQSEDCEIKLEKTHRCSDNVFKFARQNYNKVLSQIRNSQSIKNLQNKEISDYLNDLEVSEDLQANGNNGRVIIMPTISAVSTIIDLKFKELLNEEVCEVFDNKILFL
jgi:superfamily I DNA/RNA helicase